MALESARVPASELTGAPTFRPALYRYRFADVQFDEAMRMLRVAGAVVDVEPLPLDLLAALLRRPNEVVTRGELFAVLWDGRAIVDHVLGNAVWKLRRALGSQAAGCIVNLPRVGYRFSGPLERVAIDEARAAEAPAVVLAVGEAVPHRDGFRLERTLETHAGTTPSVWLASHCTLGTRRVYKFAAEGIGPEVLEREAASHRLLHRRLGDRADFVRLVSTHLADAPGFTEWEHGGDDLRQWSAVGGNLELLDPAARLGLFLKVAGALAAAHSVGVLHGNLTPGRILVGGMPGHWTVRLAGFGSGPAESAESPAAALEDDASANPAPAAPPDFISAVPARLASSVGHRAPELLPSRAPTMRGDVHALGVILWQLLAGDFSRPMKAGWESEIASESIREDIAAATEARPERRLATVSDLIERLESLEARAAQRAAGRHARACQAELTALLQRERGRQPRIAAAFAGLAICLVTSLWFIARADAEASDYRQEALIARSINGFMQREALQWAQLSHPDTTDTLGVVDVLQQASAHIAERFAGQPKVQASVRRQLGDLYLQVFRPADARSQYDAAIAVLAPLMRPTDPELLALRFASARTLVGRFEGAAAEAKLAEAEKAVAVAPQVAREDPELQWLAMQARVEVMLDSHREREALPVALDLVRASDRLAASDLSARFDARHHLIEIYARLGEDGKAAALLAEIMKPPYTEAEVGGVLYADAKLLLAHLHVQQQRLGEAQALLVEVRDTWARAFGPNELRVAQANREIADLCNARGDFQAATTAARAALAGFAASLGGDHRYTRAATLHLALNELDAGHSSEALRSLEAIRPRMEDDPQLAGSVAGIDFARARALDDLGKPGDSWPLLNSIDAVKLAEGGGSARHWFWKLQAEKGRAALLLGRRGEGLALLRPAVTELARLASADAAMVRYRQLLPEATQLATR